MATKKAKATKKKSTDLTKVPAPNFYQRKSVPTESLWDDIPWIRDIAKVDARTFNLNPLIAISHMRSVVEKSTLAQAFVNTVRSNVIGSTTPYPTLSGVKNKKDRENLRLLWKKFSMDPTTEGTMSLAAYLRATISSMIVDGRVFGILRRHEDYPCGIAVLPVTRDYLAGQEGTGDVVQYRSQRGSYEGQEGIIRGDSGRVTHYAFRGTEITAEEIIRDRAQQPYPLARGQSGSYEVTVVPAAQVIDLFEPRDCTDLSGTVSHLAPAMHKLAEIARLDAAVVQSMELSATKYGFITQDKDAPATAELMEAEAENYTPNPTEFVEGAIEVLTRGADFKEYKAAAPNGSISQYRSEVLMNIAVALSMDYGSLSGDLRGVNYSSLRHAAIMARENHRVLQQAVESRVLRHLFKALMQTAMLRGEISLTKESFNSACMSDFRMRSQPFVDPSKDILAAKEAVKLGIDSPQRIAQEQGRDYDQIAKELGEAKKIAEANGLPFPPDQPSQPAGTPPGGEEKPKPEENDD